MRSASQWNLFSIKENRFCEALVKDKESPQADTSNYHKTNCLIRPTDWLQIPDLHCVGCILSHVAIASKAVQDIAMHIVTATYHMKKCAQFLIPYRDNEYTGKRTCRCPWRCNIAASPPQHCRKKQFLYWQRMCQTKLDFLALMDSAIVSIGDRMTDYTLLNLKIQDLWGAMLCC
jgi:hypothetical protein